jgi:hypothetical protein
MCFAPVHDDRQSQALVRVVVEENRVVALTFVRRRARLSQRIDTDFEDKAMSRKDLVKAIAYFRLRDQRWPGQGQREAPERSGHAIRQGCRVYHCGGAQTSTASYGSTIVSWWADRGRIGSYFRRQMSRRLIPGKIRAAFGTRI